MPHQTKWTFMVYMAGDNDLEANGLRDLQEMQTVGSSSDLAIVAQFDTGSDQKTRRYHLTRGADPEGDCIAELPGINTGDPQYLIEFIQWACHYYTAENYALILWNHGNGWKDFDIYDRARKIGGEATIHTKPLRSITDTRATRALFSTSLDKMVSAAVRRGVLFDKSAADFLDNQELTSVLLASSPALDGKLRLIGFDACLMNMLEINYQVRPWCEIVVGSQEIEPMDGWPYNRLLASLAANPEMTPAEFAETIVREYTAHYRQAKSSQPVTQSAIYPAAIEPLCRAVSHLGSALSVVAKSRPGVEMIIDALRLGQRFKDLDYIDLKQYAQILVDLHRDEKVAQAAEKVLEQFASCHSPILASDFYGDDTKDAHGISIYLPSRIYSPLYDELQFSLHYQWDEFLRTFHAKSLNRG